MALTLQPDALSTRSLGFRDSDIEAQGEDGRPAYTSNVAIRRSAPRSFVPNIETSKVWPPQPQQRPRLLGLPSKVSKKRSRDFQVPTSFQRQVRLRGFPADVFHQEPFNAYPIATIGCVHQMVEYYLRVWAPQQGKPFAVEGHPNPYLTLVFPYALQHAVLFESIVAMCRVSALQARQEVAVHDRGFAYHHTNAKHALQLRLDSAATRADDVTILTLAALATIDYTLGEHGTAQAYLDGIQRMIELRGGLRDDTAWERFMTSVISAFQAMWMFVLPSNGSPQSPAPPSPSGSTPILQNEIPVYENHPFTQSFCESLSKLPEAFSNLAVVGVLSVQIVRLIGKIPRTTATPNSDSPMTPASPQPSDLGGVLTDLLRLATLQTTRIEHLLCYALVAYCLPLQYPLPLKDSSIPVLASCVEAYMTHNPNGEQMDRKCLIWVAIVIASAVEMSTDLNLAQNTILDQALGRYPQMKSARDTIQIMQSFLWHDELAPQWQRTWHAAVERRQRASPISTRPSPSSRGMPLASILIQEQND